MTRQQFGPKRIQRNFRFLTVLNDCRLNVFFVKREQSYEGRRTVFARKRFFSSFCPRLFSPRFCKTVFPFFAQECYNFYVPRFNIQDCRNHFTYVLVLWSCLEPPPIMIIKWYHDAGARRLFTCCLYILSLQWILSTYDYFLPITQV